MAKKRGVLITIGILVAITIGSFAIWSIPQNYETTIVVTNFESHLNGIKEIHITISDGLEKQFQNMLDRNLTPNDYIETSEIASSQINSLIIQLVESKAPENWQQSYLNYLESLREYNSFIRETSVVAKMVEGGSDEDKIQNSLNRANELRENSRSLSIASDQARP